MPSTYSPSLRLELIGAGEQIGSWNVTTNSNLGTLIEQSIVGVVAVTMIDANYTLTNLNGVTDEARQSVLVIGGTNTVVRDVIAPLVKKVYIVRNSTIGGFAINIRAASGTSVNIPSGTRQIVYCDGVNFNAVLNEISVAAGAGISVNTVGTVATVTNAGVKTIAGGTGISLSAGAGDVIVTNTGVTSVNGVTGAITTGAYFPSGGIIMWSGSIGSIPAGWFLCDGLNGTPNLQDRFIIGAGSSYAVNAFGGTADAVVVAHAHTIVDAGHVHTYDAASATSAMTAGGTSTLTTLASTNTGSVTTGIVINATGVSGTGANLPPYFALAYIQKS
jgi:hypothetical protein